MRVGIDTFTIRELNLNPFQTLDYLSAHGLAGAQFGTLDALSKTRDAGELKAVRQYADEKGLYSHISLPTCNPQLVKGDLAEHRKCLAHDIRLAAQCGWHELHSAAGNGDERYTHAVPWVEHLDETAKFIRTLGPVLREHGSRINLETHGDVTTFELVRLVESVGPDIAGICLDTANVLCHAEDPVAAARRAAPYTHLTHTKDAIIYFIAAGYRRQTRPAGQGVLDWRTILPILAAYAPDLPLSIEDHKWFFEAHIFDRHWLSLHPDLTREELARVTQHAWQIQQQIFAGVITAPDAYEAPPFLTELEERLTSGQHFLEETLRHLGLETA